MLWKIPGPENLTIQFLNSKNFFILYTKKLGDTLSGKIFHAGTHFYGGGSKTSVSSSGNDRNS